MKAMTEREFLAQKGLADPASGWCLISLDQIKNYGQSKVESDIKRNLMQLRLNIKRKELLPKKSIADW